MVTHSPRVTRPEAEGRGAGAAVSLSLVLRVFCVSFCGVAFPLRIIIHLSQLVEGVGCPGPPKRARGGEMDGMDGACGANFHHIDKPGDHWFVPPGSCKELKSTPPQTGRKTPKPRIAE